MISWSEVKTSCTEEGPTQRQNRLLVTFLFKLLHWDTIEIESPRDYSDELFEQKILPLFNTAQM